MKKFITIWISCSLVWPPVRWPSKTKRSQHRRRNSRKKPARRSKGNRRENHGPPGLREPHAVKTVKEPVAATPNAKAMAGQHEKERNASKASTTANQPVIPAHTEATAQTQAQAPIAPQTVKPNPGAHRAVAQTKKPDIPAIKAQHANFHANQNRSRSRASRSTRASGSTAASIGRARIT